MTALLATRAAAWATPPAAESSLPIGSPITIVSDETVDPRVRPYSEFRAHLRDPLTVGDTLVATAGTPARIIVLATSGGAGGTTSYRIAITDLNLGVAGTLPVRPDSPTVERISTGMAIPSRTLAAVGFEEGKVRVVVPLPFVLPNDTPNPIYTPAPLRTANPILNQPRGRRRGPSPTPSLTPAPAPSASGGAPSASPSPAPTASPQPPDLGPYPAGTNPPPGTPVVPSPTPPGPPLPSRVTPLPLPT